MSTTGLFEARRAFSDERLKLVREGMRSIENLAATPQLAIYTTGSYGRREASKYSDLDLFFVVAGDPPSRIDKTLIDAQIIELTRDLELPEFSGDGEYLEIHELEKMKLHLGTPADDYENFFTARLLLLLESVPVCREEAYESILSQTVDMYFRDFVDHELDFRPLFLLNDIVRFWRTVCLNYESGRGDESKKNKARLKNLKLKYSRAFTCFSTVMHLVKQPGMTPSDVLDVVRLPPVERVSQAAESLGDGGRLATAVLGEYAWFLEQTGREGTEVLEWIGDDANHDDAMAHADRFGSALYQLVFDLADNAGLSRYLVV